MIDIETPDNQKKAFTGLLKTRVVHVRNLMGKINAKNNISVVVRVDGLVKCRTKIRSKLHWDEEFEIQCDKAGEIEFSVRDEKDGILSLLFFRLAELEAQIKAQVTFNVRSFLTFVPFVLQFVNTLT